MKSLAVSSVHEDGWWTARAALMLERARVSAACSKARVSTARAYVRDVWIALSDLQFGVPE
jgi:hypothetical protein